MASVPQKEIYRRTIETLEASCRSHPGNPKLLLQLALAYLKAGHFHQRALQLYNQVSDLFPGDIKVQRAVSIGYMIGQGRELIHDVPSLDKIDKERLGRSIEQLRKLAVEYPDSAEIHRALGDLQLIRGEYRDALQHYRSALALGIEDLESLTSHYEAVQALFTLPPNVSVFFADIYQRLGAMDHANRIFKKMLADGEVDPQTLESYNSFLVRRLEQVPNDSEAGAELIRQICHVSLLQDRPKEALTWARTLGPEALADHPELVKLLSRILIEMEDYRQAFDYLSKIRLDHEAKGLLNQIAVLLEQRGEIDTAVFLLQFINDHDVMEGGLGGMQNLIGAQDLPKPPEKPPHTAEWEIEINTELQLAELNWKNRRWKSSFEAYLRVLELGYEDYKSILEPLDSLLERIPDIETHHLIFMSNFFAEKRDWRRTLYYAERAMFLDPTLDDIRARLLQACEQIILQNPDSCEVRLKLGDLHLERGNIERAMKEFRKVATYPEFGMKANRRLALALQKAGDLKAAFQKYQSLPVLETEDLERLYDLMISFQNADQWKLAFEAATLIKDFDPNFRDVTAKITQFEKKVAAQGAEFSIDPKMRELIGDHSIGRYRYVDKIGSGGMGVVHKVTDLKTNTVVAMKILREGLSGSDKAIDRFFREARIAATLHHRNIVNILDYNISNIYGQSYIAMEFVDGPSLRDIVEDKFAESVDIDKEYILGVVDWMVQLCAALDATHTKGIIHRDIKPDNIMVAPNNIVKVTDFGIVHIEEATFTPTGALIGTPRYMSPEQVHGGRIDSRSDIYAVGIILYEMLIGSPPFISGDISYQQVNVLPTNPREINPLVPEDVDGIVMKCLEKNPNDRFQIARDLRADLERVFIRLGGNGDRLRSLDTDGDVQPLKAGDLHVTPVQFIKQHDTEEAPMPPPPPTKKGRVPQPSDDDFDADAELDLHDEDRDRHDRIVPRSSASDVLRPVSSSFVEPRSAIAASARREIARNKSDSHIDHAFDSEMDIEEEGLSGGVPESIDEEIEMEGGTSRHDVRQRTGEMERPPHMRNPNSFDTPPRIEATPPEQSSRSRARRSPGRPPTQDSQHEWDDVDE